MRIKVGEIYEDCSYHPVLCTKSEGNDIQGISLIDGSFPRSCSIKHCAVVKLSLKAALKIKLNGPSDSKKQHLKHLQLAGWCHDFKVWWK